MNKGDLVEVIAKKLDMPKSQVDEVIKLTVETIAKTVKKSKDNTVQLVGLGTFKQVKRKARMGVNPITGERIKIAARKTVKFTASSNLKKI